MLAVRQDGPVPTERSFVDADDLPGLIQAAFGSTARLRELTRLRGGTSEGVYRLTLDDARTAILYVWDPAEDYWPVAAPEGGTDFFAAGAGMIPFATAHARLEALGIRVPSVVFIDGSRRHLPADLAVVEDVAGGTLESLLARDPVAGRAALARLSVALRLMHGHTAPHPGRDGMRTGDDRSCEQIVLDRAVHHLRGAAARVPRLAAVEDRLGYALRELAAAVIPRSSHGLIHGELGPDHVLIDDSGQPVLIDIEGTTYFDIEWEHVFLQLRFREDYEALRAPGLDEHRMALYRLAMHLSLVEGPLRLLDGDFPHRDVMQQIAEWNVGYTLDCLQDFDDR
jgi:aminoglycoside phosphotransferase (APT) family kinase protein